MSLERLLTPRTGSNFVALMGIKSHAGLATFPLFAVGLFGVKSSYNKDWTTIAEPFSLITKRLCTAHFVT